MRAWILYAHGSSDPRWVEPFHAIIERLRPQLPGDTVELAFLERQSPDLNEAVRAVVARGATEVRIVPMFLGIGAHLRKDLPQRVQTVRQAWPELDLTLTESIGESPLMGQAIADWIAGSR